MSSSPKERLDQDEMIAGLLGDKVTPDQLVLAMQIALTIRDDVTVRVMTVWLNIADEQGGFGWVATTDVADRACVDLVDVINARDRFDLYLAAADATSIRLP